MDTATADADIDTPGTTPDDRRPPGGLRPGEPRPGQPVPGTAEDRPAALMSKTDPATGKPVPVRADGAATEEGLPATDRPGPTKPLHTVRLERMKRLDTKANVIVDDFIVAAEDTMQKSVNVLGFGRSDPPPPPRGGRMPTKVRTADLPGSGSGVEMYKQQVFSANARQDSLVDMDAQVDGTSQMVAAEQARTLLEIIHIESDLNSALLTVASKKLSSNEAAAVMDHIAAAVDKVKEVVAAAQDVNVGAAGGGSGSGGSTGGGTGAAGGAAAGAAGGLGSMLPMLAMLPMALMPMLGQLPELLGQKEDEDKDGEDEPESQPAPSAAGPASDPTAPAPPSGAAPTPGEKAPQDPGSTNPQNNIPYGPTSPSKQV
ncbi:hypothetical protein [Nocardia sienata]|uniref:hypothetical protein n=1 Tax=Nocardia sienata TaxID=248552 RepID=UPI0007A46A88|nr:hypothetical protein [Nocardia sienata]